MHDSNKNLHYLDVIGLVSIGLVSLGYLFLKRSFAEVNIQFSFLNFPIFIGEIILGVCLAAILIKWSLVHPRLNHWHYLIFAYFAFVMVKAIYGYCTWGPLAFRHAALFYYPIFAVFGFYFFNKDFFGPFQKVFLSGIIICVFIGGRWGLYWDGYWMMTCVLLGIILINSISHKTLRLLMSVIFISSIPFGGFFDATRTVFVSNIMVFLFLGISFYQMHHVGLKKRRIYLLLILILVVIGTFKYANHGSILSILKASSIIQLFKEKDEIINKRIDHYTLRPRPAQLFRPELERQLSDINHDYSVFLSKLNHGYSHDYSVFLTNFNQQKNRVIEIKRQNIEEKNIEEKSIEQIASFKEQNDLEKNSNESVKKIEPTDVQKNAIRVESHHELFNFDEGWMTTKMANVVFRLLIWRDIIVELKKERAIFGFDFGKPLRSISLEILDWGVLDWGKDGWVEAHNSYLHIIYRSGIIGVILIILFFNFFLKMTRESIHLNLISGVLLCGAILSSLVMACFQPIFELPYSAIPFWSLFGMGFRYCLDMRENKELK